MKKTIAAGGASVLGLAAVSLGSAPAQAADDPVVDPCLNGDMHVPTIGGLSSNWYMDCIPQYGLAQVEFTIDPSDVPAGFGDITDSDVTVTASGTSSDAATYFGLPPENVIPDVYFNAGEWVMQAYLPIESVQGIADPTTLPAACAGGTYSSAFMVNYSPQTIAFSQTIDGVEVVYEIDLNQTPLYLGLNILDNGVFDTEAAQCVVSGETTAWSPNYLGDGWAVSVTVATSAPGSSVTLSPYFGEGKDLGEIAPTITEPEPEEPTLPATGVDAGGTAGLAAMFIALGVAGGYLRRRQSRA